VKGSVIVLGDTLDMTEMCNVIGLFRFVTLHFRNHRNIKCSELFLCGLIYKHCFSKNIDWACSFRTVGYYSRSFFVCIWTELKAKLTNCNILQSGPLTQSITYIFAGQTEQWGGHWDLRYGGISLFFLRYFGIFLEKFAVLRYWKSCGTQYLQFWTQKLR
jgi:hypothetical protein